MKRKKKDDNLIFTEQTQKDEQGNLIKVYKIGEKTVDSSIYNSMFEDQILDKMSPEIKPIEPPTPIPENDNMTDEDTAAFQQIVNIVKSMDEDEAVDYIANFITNNASIVYQQAQIDTLRDMGDQCYTTAASIENNLNQQLDELGDGENEN